MTDAFITVRVGKIPGRLEEYALNGDRTVAAALRIANLEQGNFQVRVNGEAATAGSTLKDGDTVVLTQQIKGNA